MSDDETDVSGPEATKRLIAKELELEQPNWRVIERLSRGYVESDPDSVRFTVDAGHIQRLGAELVGKPETALSELIKNAYDADARTVSLDFTNHRRVGGRLLIKDDGSGMDDAVIRNTWMRISTASKVEQPFSPLYHRVRAGRKGIGRFSVQRLGTQLHLETKPIGSSTGYRVIFDWDEAFRSGRDLIDIFSLIERFEKDPEDSGTTLDIRNLRDSWPETTISRVWRSVLLLQPPFPTARVGVEATAIDPGFAVSINNVTQNAKREEYSIERSFLSQAIAKIEASIDAEGTARVRVISPKLGLDDSQQFDERYVVTGPVNFSAHYFIYSASTLSGMSQSAAAEMGRLYGGIRIYRNGFRVLPYGEAADDWLELDADVSRRELLIPANNRNFFGQVELSSANNPRFEETSSREGLLENDAFVELRRFARVAVEWAAKRVASARNRKQDAGQRNFIAEPRKPSEFLRKLIENMGAPKPDSASATASPEDVLKQVAVVATEYEESVERQRAASLEYEEMLRLLASLGLSISVFGHEVKGTRDAMTARLQLLNDAVEALSGGAQREAVERQLREMNKSAERLFDIGGYIGGLMSRTESRELRALSVKGALERFADQFSEYMSKQGVSFEISVQPEHLRTTPMHASEMDSVLLNFLTNSIKSMKRSKVKDRRVRMDATRDGKHVVIGFEDNGGGVPFESRSRVFDAFFTTTMAADDDGIAGPGTGLGLKIVADIAASYGGSASIGEPSTNYNCRFEFRVLSSEAA